MPNLTSVSLTNGQGSGGTGTVSTVDALMADGGQSTIGATTDAAVAAGASGTVSAKLRAISRDLNFGGLATTSGTSGVRASVGPPAVPIDQYGEYKTIAASQSAALCGSSGAQFDYLAGVLIIPATTSPGNVLIRDGNGSDITIFTGGATSVGDLRSFMVPLGLYAQAGTTAGWRITTGANVSVIAIGNFT